MPDWQTLPFAIDVSHHNGAIDWPKVAAQQPAVVFLKAAERRWTDPMFERNRKACADLSLPWVPYVFLRPEDEEQTFRYFLDVVGDPSVPAALDWEEPAGQGSNPVPASVVEAWIDAMPRMPLAYYGYYPPAAPTAKIGRCPRWYAQYPGSATASPRLPMWDGSPDTDWRKCWLVWQWSDKGGIQGISGNVDLNCLACSAERFRAWYQAGDFAGGQAGAPHPDPVEPPRIKPARARPAELQRRLVELGYDIKIDGVAGELTCGAALDSLKRL